jgi:hypothetical protein
MRILLVLAMVTSSFLLRAQTVQQFLKDSSYRHHTQIRKWSVTPYSNIGVGFNFMNGSSATIVSAPIGLQVNRQLNNNLYAFTGVSLAPTYINFNRPFLSPGSKSYAANGFKPNYFGVNPSINMGLMYVNDAKTFSVSGSIGIQKTNEPMLLYPGATIQRLNTFPLAPVYR